MSQTSNQPFYNIRTPDYFLDDTNQGIPPGYRSHSDDFDSKANSADPGDSVWHEQKKQKQQPLNGCQSEYFQQIIDEKYPNPKQSIESFKNDGNFMQSYDLNG